MAGTGYSRRYQTGRPIILTIEKVCNGCEKPFAIRYWSSNAAPNPQQCPVCRRIADEAHNARLTGSTAPRKKNGAVGQRGKKSAALFADILRGAK